MNCVIESPVSKKLHAADAASPVFIDGLCTVRNAAAMSCRGCHAWSCIVGPPGNWFNCEMVTFAANKETKNNSFCRFCTFPFEIIWASYLYGLDMSNFRPWTILTTNKNPIETSTKTLSWNHTLPGIINFDSGHPCQQPQYPRVSRRGHPRKSPWFEAIPAMAGPINWEVWMDPNGSDLILYHWNPGPADPGPKFYIS